MKATNSDSGIKEASAAADVKGQMELREHSNIVITALHLASQLTTCQDCPDENHEIVVMAMEALKVLKEKGWKLPSTISATRFTDVARIEYLEQHPETLLHCTWVNAVRGRIFTMGCEFDPTVGDCHKTLRDAIDKALSAAAVTPTKGTN